MAIEATETTATEPSFAVLRRFLPYLWPAGEPGLKARVIVSLLTVPARDDEEERALVERFVAPVVGRARGVRSGP